MTFHLYLSNKFCQHLNIPVFRFKKSGKQTQAIFTGIPTCWVFHQLSHVPYLIANWLLVFMFGDNDYHVSVVGFLSLSSRYVISTWSHPTPPPLLFPLSHLTRLSSNQFLARCTYTGCPKSCTAAPKLSSFFYRIHYIEYMVWYNVLRARAHYRWFSRRTERVSNPLGTVHLNCSVCAVECVCTWCAL